MSIKNMSNCHFFIFSSCYTVGVRIPRPTLICIFIYISHHNKQSYHPFKPIMNIKPVGRGILAPTFATINHIQIPNHNPTFTPYIQTLFSHHIYTIGVRRPRPTLICIFIYISHHNKQPQQPIQIYEYKTRRSGYPHPDICHHKSHTNPHL